jgi:hypothetical protein
MRLAAGNPSTHPAKGMVVPSRRMRRRRWRFIRSRNGVPKPRGHGAPKDWICWGSDCCDTQRLDAARQASRPRELCSLLCAVRKQSRPKRFGTHCAEDPRRQGLPEAMLSKGLCKLAAHGLVPASFGGEELISFLETPKIRDTPVIKCAVSRRSPVEVAMHELEWPGQRLICTVPAVRTRHQLRRLMGNGVRVVSES